MVANVAKDATQFDDRRTTWSSTILQIFLLTIVMSDLMTKKVDTFIIVRIIDMHVVDDHVIVIIFKIQNKSIPRVVVDGGSRMDTIIESIMKRLYPNSLNPLAFHVRMAYQRKVEPPRMLSMC